MVDGVFNLLNAFLVLEQGILPSRLTDGQIKKLGSDTFTWLLRK